MNLKKTPRIKTNGFSLTELLITLAIMSVIAVFTIPKLLQVTSSNYNTQAHEVQKMLVQAYTKYKLNDNTPTSAFRFSDITPYINYIRVASGGEVADNEPTWPGISCSAGWTGCLMLNTGGILQYSTLFSFGGTATTNGIYVLYDPNSQKFSGAGVTANGPEKAVEFYLFYDGRVLTTGNMPTPYYFDGSTITTDPPSAARVPVWWTD
jgi:prepilin-type N-terminal cleavage/methylation domain-containing protein